jgi:hypothetical protein
MFTLALAFLFASPVDAPASPAPTASRCEIVGVYSEMEWTDTAGVYHYDFEATFDCADGGAKK